MQNRELKTVDDAIHFVENIIFMPGFTFQCRPFTADSIELTVFMDVIDTDTYPTYDAHLLDPFSEYVTVKLQNIPTTDHLARTMIDLSWALVERTWKHEAREFFRVREITYGENHGITEEWHAPFHPHHYSNHAGGSGLVRWENAELLETVKSEPKGC
jgi:hypothetical protein